MPERARVAAARAEGWSQLTLSARLAQLERLSNGRPLSRREAQIVDAGARGLQTKATAAELGLSPKTVDELWRRVYRKLECGSRIEVLARLLAVELGLERAASASEERPAEPHGPVR